MTLLIAIMMMLAYLLGSVSSVVLMCKLFRLPDPRLHGSGNPGATNVLRLGGKLPALLVLVFDILKGTIPVWGAYFLKIEPVWLGAIGICACIGHIYPLFFGFKGGKAVATAFGAMMPIGLDLAGLLVGSWLLIIALSGYSSLAAIITVALAPLFTYMIKPLYTIPVLMLSILIIARHRENIMRLYKGKESKVWDKSKRIRE